MKNIYTSTIFLRTLLERCIGTVMIDWGQWNFQEPSFDRGYFNDRLKHTSPINKLTHQRLNRLFEVVFSPGNRTGRFQEPQAVDTANALITLIAEFFCVDVSVWKNTHVGDNRASRSHLLSCLDTILSLTESQEFLPSDSITQALNSYMENVASREKNPVIEMPKPLTLTPYQQTDHFLGREHIISRIITELLSGRSCYLYGMGGIGKTEIAKSVLKQILDMPTSESGITHVMWISYTDGNFALSLVRALHLTEDIHNLEQAFQKALSIINQYRDRLLLVIDNVENEEDEYLLSLSNYINCRVLVTSRCKGFSSLLEIPVPTLSVEDCMSLFYAYYHGMHDDITLRKILDLTDCLTVAVELFAKIADCEELFLHEFYGSLVRCGFNISTEEVSTVHEKLRSEASVTEQFTKLFQVYGCNAEEQLLLIQTSTIPNIHFVFDQAKRWFSLKNRTLLNRLEKSGWLKKEALYDDGRRRYQYYMHSVIASAVRAQFLEQLYTACNGFIQEITIEMQDSLTKNDAVKKELIQFSWSLNDIFQGQFQSESDCDFLWALAEIYRDIGYYERTFPLLDLLDTLYTALYGIDCVQMGPVWNSRGLIHYELSHFDDALLAYQKSHAILTGHLEPDNISALEKTELAKLDLNIGKIYLKQDYTKAEPYFNRAYEVLLKEKGENHHLTLNALGHKAMFIAHIGQLQEAEAIFTTLLDKIAPDTEDRSLLFIRAGAAHHLGSIYSDYAPTKAMPFLTEARNIFWRLLSPTHPDTLDVLNSIGSLRLSTEEDYPQILSYFRRLLEMFQKAYGSNDPNTGTVYNNIGLCYYYMGQPDEAIANYREAIRIDRFTYGDDHESTAYIYNNIGAVYSESDHPEKAIPEHERALKIYETAYPDQLNLDLALTHADLADAYLREGDGDKTMEHLNHAFAIYDQMLPSNARQLIYPYSTLANLLAALGETDTAITNYAYAVQLMLENGYANDSDAVQEYEARISDLKQVLDEAF